MLSIYPHIKLRGGIGHIFTFSYKDTPYCTLQSTTLPYAALKGVHYNVLQCTALYYTTLYSKARTALYYNALHYTALHCITLRCTKGTALHFTALHGSVYSTNCFALFCTGFILLACTAHCTYYHTDSPSTED